MSRTILAGFLGALVLMIWGFLSWEVLPFHKSAMHSVSNEDAVLTALKAGNAETGAYMVPGMGTDEASRKAAEEKMKIGPTAFVHYRTGGYDMAMYFIKGFLIYFFSAMIAASLLSKLSWSLASKFGARVGFVVTLGIFLAVTSRIGDWNWMGYATDFSLGLAADDIIGWTLAGLVIAWRIKPMMTKKA